MPKIYCKNTESYVKVEGGETLAHAFTRISSDCGPDSAAGSDCGPNEVSTSAPLPLHPVVALVNNRAEDLDFPIFMPKTVEYLGADSDPGRRVVSRGLRMLLYKALTMVMPDTELRVEHSISNGYYCRVYDAAGAAVCLDAVQIKALEDTMRDLVARNLPFRRHQRLTTDVIELMRSQGMHQKALLLSTLHQLYATYYTLDGIADSYYGPLPTHTADLPVFALIPYHEGMLLLPPDSKDPTVAAKPVEQRKMLGALSDYLRFNRTIGVGTMGELNVAVRAGQAPHIVNVAEAMHYKILSRIADRIADLHSEGRARVILLAGPSSSGKTTTCKRLAIQLQTNNITPRLISLDDYFVDREQTPRDTTGDYDYESLYALDLERFNADILALLEGHEINLPTYSFELGRRVEKPKPLSLGPDEVLLIEGIHGLNPELSRHIPADQVFRIYVSALTTLAIDSHNAVSTTDTRILRRIVRDHKYRATNAIETIRRWPSVRRGEEKWIFPYQENADATFNSSLLFELSVMRPFAEPLLRQVPEDAPEHDTATRLLTLLSQVDPIPLTHIPSTSLLREFLGGSSFKY